MNKEISSVLFLIWQIMIQSGRNILSPSEAPSNKMIHEMFTKATEQNG